MFSLGELKLLDIYKEKIPLILGIYVSEEQVGLHYNDIPYFFCRLTRIWISFF